jgi:hypothetical protein
MAHFEPIIMCGVELEFEFNFDALGPIAANGYHDEVHTPKKFGKYFIGEQDGSIRCTSFDNPGAVEIVSNPFNINEWEAVVNDFESEMKRRAKITGCRNDELDELISFNHSTGAHIHINLYRPDVKTTIVKVRDRATPVIIKGTEIIFRDSVTEEVLITIREALKQKVKDAFSASFYNRWVKDLYRGMMSVPMGDTINYENRYCEWNLSMKNNRIEYRGFHLHGIEDWDNFKKIYSLLFSAIKEVICAEFAKDKPFKSKPMNIFGIVANPDKVEMVEDVCIFLPKLGRRRRYSIKLDDAIEGMEVF